MPPSSGPPSRRRPPRGLTGIVLLGSLAVLAGCGSGASGGAGSTPPSVTVRVDGQQVSLDPTQYCLDDAGQRYRTTPPIIEVSPDSTILLTVPDQVAAAGWSVQVFDQKLVQKIGQVDVDPHTPVLSKINSSDVVPPTFYLVVVEKSDPNRCKGLSGAWPVGFIRAPDAASVATGTPTPTAG